MRAHRAERPDKSRTIMMGAGIALLIAASTTGVVLTVTDSGSSSTGHTAARPPARVAHVAGPASGPTAQDSLVPVGDVSKSASHQAKPGATAKAGSAGKSKAITYVVKPGDNLFVIAAWFHQHGYGKLYELNKSVIGSNPSLIFPGQRITISRAGSMSLSH